MSNKKDFHLRDQGQSIIGRFSPIPDDSLIDNMRYLHIKAQKQWSVEDLADSTRPIHTMPIQTSTHVLKSFCGKKIFII